MPQLIWVEKLCDFKISFRKAIQGEKYYLEGVFSKEQALNNELGFLELGFWEKGAGGVCFFWFMLTINSVTGLIELKLPFLYLTLWVSICTVAAALVWQSHLKELLLIKHVP